MCVIEKRERKAYMCGGACNPALVRRPEGDFGVLISPYSFKTGSH